MINTRQKLILFPTAVFKYKIGDKNFIDEMEYEVQKLKNSEQGTIDGRDFVSVDNIHELEQFKKLKELIEFEVRTILEGMTVIHKDFEITGMWANITGPNNRHPTHIHPNSFLSGVIYLKTPDKCAPLVIHDPRPGARVFEPNYENPNYLNMAIYENLPEKGDFLIWPSWLPHGTCLLYTSPSPRDRQKSRMPSSA